MILTYVLMTGRTKEGTSQSENQYLHFFATKEKLYTGAVNKEVDRYLSFKHAAT